MTDILNKVRNVDPNNSDAVKETLSSFFHNLTKNTAADSNRWLRALEDIINRFAKYCGSYRNTIETFLTNFIDSSNYYNVIAAAKCALSLQQVRPLQDKNSTPKACWRDYLMVLCNAAHKLLGLLFPNSVDIYDNSNNTQNFQLQSTATSPLGIAFGKINAVPNVNHSNKQTVFGTRLRNVFIFLQASLVETFPVPKPIQPQLILEVIVRALSISSGAKGALDISKAVSVKVQALRTIDALVACLGSNLIPFSSLILKFVMLTLTWTRENCDNEEVQQVRCGAYGCLRGWLRTLHTLRPADSPRARALEDELVAHVLADVTPHKHIVQLTMSNQSTKHLSKKAKRKLANTMLQESSIASHASAEKNKVQVSTETSDEVAIAALECAEVFLNVSGVFLKPTTHKMLQERIVRECYNLEAYRSGRALCLLRVLDALRRNSPPTAPPPTQYCLDLYSTLINSRMDEVSRFCSQALLEIRLHLHCSPPSISFALQVDESVKRNAKPKKLSSRNRAALESLLGVDKVPSISEEQVVDLGEEPAKRRRLESDIEDIADKISVSSASVESVEEVSDESDDDVEEVEEVHHSQDEIDAEQAKSIQETDQQTNDVEMTETINEDNRVTVEQVESDENVQEIVAISPNDEPMIQDTDGTKAPKEIKPRENTIDSISNNETQVEETVLIQPVSNGFVEEKEESAQAADGMTSIHDANTQMPLNSVDDKLMSSQLVEVEIVYDSPEKCNSKRTLIEGTEDEVLPSSNETDDQITCGQVMKCSQNADSEKNKENEEPKVNGDSNIADIPAKGDVATDKLLDISVDVMLADFVDEVN